MALDQQAISQDSRIFRTKFTVLNTKICIVFLRNWVAEANILCYHIIVIQN